MGERHAPLTLPLRAAQSGGGIGLALMVALVLLGPLLWPLDPAALDLLARNQGPSPSHPLGTDQLGRDMLAALIRGGRISLLVAGMAMAVALCIGVAIGVMAATLRWLDAPLMRLTDLFLALPLLPLVLVILMLWRETLTARLGSQAGVTLLVVAVIGLTGWMQTARVVRAEVLSLRERDFMRAARALGVTPWQMIRRHILPNISGVIAVSAGLGMANAILTESALSFLGLGFPADFPSWGRLLYDGIGYMEITPWRVLGPGAAITLTVLAVSALGDALHHASDPRRLRPTRGRKGRSRP